MIAYIKGIFEEITEDGIVVEAGGVGYGIAVPPSLASELTLGDEVKIYTYYQVAEDMQKLYGFASREDRRVFTQLLKVSGIGPKLAMSIMSSVGTDELKLAVITNDVKTLSRAPGLGKKTAEKLILELKDSFDAAEVISGTKAPQGAPLVMDDAFSEAAQALMALGYSSSEAMKAVRQVEPRDGITVDDVLQEAFRHLAAF